jgi:putative salt-induced outer membrane protein YdiY
VALASVVRIEELESGFWQRLSGSMSVGFDYAKSTGIRSSNINISSAYQGDEIKATLDISASETSSPDTETSERENITSTVQFQRERPSFVMLLNTLERNDELGIDARLTTGAGLARYFAQDQDSEVMLFAGGVANQEWTDTGDGLEEDETQQSLEAALGATWRIFRFGDPDVSLSASAFLYPSLTESGRHRGNLDVSLRREIISDLFFDVSFYESYDSDPPSGGETTDYGITTSLGYKF